ncbi:hypothetical protein E2562_005574 [Oryza meyeriana var. granulata]|uniref:Uncharacterized protein n=1 Tax=Oryza meyeriana var. granulata TaxID=110450 RepID=A0A6G1F3Y5_9ORYZ|nr:hypothetical protein E2562_005574 [Oryza meyeriana var. granulata]
MFVVNKRDNAGIMMDRIVKQEVEGTGWVKTMRTQLVDIAEQIEGGVWEELVGEVLDFVSNQQKEKVYTTVLFDQNQGEPLSEVPKCKQIISSVLCDACE